MSEKAGKVNHLAIIMDGNGRWAQKRGLSRSDGHRAGIEKVIEIAKEVKARNIKYLTIYAFSTENWKRPVLEVNTLMTLLERFLIDKLPELMSEQICLKTIGQSAGLPKKVQKVLSEAITATAKNTGATLILALNYGGRLEIVDAAKKLASQVVNGELALKNLDEKKFQSALYLPEIPDPDLMIRTSGEMRLSNFLLWELSYTELYITGVHWPDFSPADLDLALAEFGRRNRRFGEIK